MVHTGHINYDTLDDRELLKLIVRNDEQAFHTIYYRYVDMLYQSAFKRLPENHLAEDIVQEVFIVFYKKRSQLREVDNLKGYLLGCLQKFVVQKVRDFLIHERHHQKIRVLLPQTEPHQDLHDYKLLETRFHEALRQITERSRQIFVMRRIDKLPNKIIAQKLGISINAVEKHMRRALCYLKNEFDEHNIILLIFSLGFYLFRSA